MSFEFENQPEFSPYSSKAEIFRFEAMWLRDEECNKVIADSWESSEPLMNLSGKLRRCS